jgi:mannose-6-phosphate isomerase
MLCHGENTMTATKLITRAVEKPWGQTSLPEPFNHLTQGGKRIGEVWFEMPDDSQPELLVKYLFTSERLSIQVHPDDRAAQAAGHKRGKDEAWVVLDAEPTSTVALGTTRKVTRDELRDAALDGSIEHLMHWQSVKQGDVIYSPAGTVHAIGAGLAILEVQQNVDLTYRLYDYGRPRELHLNRGIAVSNPEPFDIPPLPASDDENVKWSVEGAKLTMTRFLGTADMYGPIKKKSAAWFIPLSGSGLICGQRFNAGECWLIKKSFELEDIAGVDFIMASPA